MTVQYRVILLAQPFGSVIMTVATNMVSCFFAPAVQKPAAFNIFVSENASTQGFFGLKDYYQMKISEDCSPSRIFYVLPVCKRRAEQRGLEMMNNLSHLIK